MKMRFEMSNRKSIEIGRENEEIKEKLMQNSQENKEKIDQL